MNPITVSSSEMELQDIIETDQSRACKIPDAAHDDQCDNNGSPAAKLICLESEGNE